MQLREFLPKTLLGRLLSLILIPMIFVQVITVFIFYERHWDTVTRHMAQNLAGEMALLVSDIGTNPDQASIVAVTEKGWQYFTFPIDFQAGAVLPATSIDPPKTYAEAMLRRELKRQIKLPWVLDVGTDPNLIFIDLQMENGVLRIYAGRKRIFSSTSWTFFGWTVGSSIILFGIALMFLRGQVRPILR